MTPEEEMGAALGAGWQKNVPAGLWYLHVGDATLEVGEGGDGRWYVVRKHGFKSWTHDWPCSSSEQAVAVAHLLVAPTPTRAPTWTLAGSSAVTRFAARGSWSGTGPAPTSRSRAAATGTGSPSTCSVPLTRRRRSRDRPPPGRLPHRTALLPVRTRQPNGSQARSFGVVEGGAAGPAGGRRGVVLHRALRGAINERRVLAGNYGALAEQVLNGKDRPEPLPQPLPRMCSHHPLYLEHCCPWCAEPVGVPV